MQANPLLQKTAEDITYDDTLNGIGATNVQGAVDKLAEGKKKNVNSITLPCGAGYGAYLFTLFTHGIGPDIIQLYVAAGTVNAKSIITGNTPTEIASTSYASNELTINFAGPTYVSYIGADTFNAF